MSELLELEKNLIYVCEKIRPERILEYGPGRSTGIMHKICPTAQIICIEHDIRWYNKAVKEHGVYAEIHLVELIGKPSKYAVWPVLNGLGDFDLVFVDGRIRISCLVVASQIIKDFGVIVLHDAKRTAYKPGINVLKQLGFIAYGEGETLFFKKSKFSEEFNFENI
jgi:predicted O-methyltransferase YrrM